MATVERDVRAPAAEVWGVLANGWLYATWVVGASRIRDVEAGWPAVGSRIHHSFGVWPAVIDDTTSVQESFPLTRLKLRSRGWPVGEADVTLTLTDEGASTKVVLEEVPAAGPGAFLARNPVADRAIAIRNREALRRLAALAEGGAGR
jgi:Polyketide cyclase / dehydrase and lipid transport